MKDAIYTSVEDKTHEYGIGFLVHKDTELYSGLSKCREKIKIMTNSFKYLGAIISDEGSKSEVLGRIAANSSTDKTEMHMAKQKNFPDTKNQIHPHTYLSLRL